MRPGTVCCKVNRRSAGRQIPRLYGAQNFLTELKKIRLFPEPL
jgi:hypothetical protein